MGKLIARGKSGLASMGKVRLLQRYGYDAAAMCEKDANRLINQIKANGWRRVEVSFE